MFVAVPYSGSVKPRVVELQPGRVLLELRDRRRVRNHLGSIHAIALTNAAELASGLSLVAGLAPEVRAIVVGLEIDFLKKGRGKLAVEGTASIPDVTADVDHEVQAVITDAAGDRVAECRVHWKLGRTAASPDSNR